MDKPDRRQSPPSRAIGCRVRGLAGTIALVAVATIVPCVGAAAHGSQTSVDAECTDGQLLHESGDSTAPAESQGADEEHEPLLEDEIRVIGERTPLTRDERMRIYRELARARELYSNNQIDEAFPLLLKTARKGFKNAQARVGHIYLRGLGEIEQDPVEALGWLGVASSGTTSPPIRNYFNEIWERIPEKYVEHFDEVVEEYRSKYGKNATGVVCELNRPARTYVKHLVCFFEQDLPDMVREPLDVHMSEDERQRMIEQNLQRIRESIESRNALPRTNNNPF